MKNLDLITIGRSSVDLYGTQIGGRLEDMTSFKKYIGGSPTNIAAGSARLGLKSAVITRVGHEHMGRFIVEQLGREGVDTRGVVTDKDRLTALVLLGIRDDTQFPLIFYRENCADMALCEDDIDPDFIRSARCVTATGTHLSNSLTEAAVLKALHLARDAKIQTALDIDYRPNLWGLAGHGAGEERFIESANVTAKLQKHLPLFDLIVGTEEEFHIAGGSTDTIAALKVVREISDAVLVCKRGPMGASAFRGDIPDSLDEGISGPGFPIEVFNVLGAGDGFMSGLLRGWLKDEDWKTSLTWANACGAFAVSRHGCAPAYPSWRELQWFLEHGSKETAIRNDFLLEHIHFATNRRMQSLPNHLTDLRNQTLDQSQSLAGAGIIADWDFERELFYWLADQSTWLGRTTFAGHENFEEWPVVHTPVIPVEGADPEKLQATLKAARGQGLETALDLSGSPSDQLQALLVDKIWPDIWILSEEQVKSGCELIEQYDPWCRGAYCFGNMRFDLPKFLGCVTGPDNAIV